MEWCLYRNRQLHRHDDPGEDGDGNLLNGVSLANRQPLTKPKVWVVA